jgi:hypothetical protein
MSRGATHAILCNHEYGKPECIHRLIRKTLFYSEGLLAPRDKVSSFSSGDFRRRCQARLLIADM